MSYLPKEIRKWVAEYNDSKTRVRLRNLADHIERLEAGVDERVQKAINAYDDTSHHDERKRADQMRAALKGEIWADVSKN